MAQWWLMRRAILFFASLTLAVATACAPSVTASEVRRAAGPDVRVDVWSSRDLPTSLVTSIRRIEGVRRASTLSVAVLNLIRERGATVALPHRRKGGVLPITVGALSPEVGGTDVLTTTVASGKAVLGAEAAALRHVGIGAKLTLASSTVHRAFTIGAVAPDSSMHGRELIVPAASATGLGFTGTRAIISWVNGGLSQHVADAIKNTAHGYLARVTVGENAPPDPSLGPTLSFAEVKRVFGEFVFKPRQGLYVAIDKPWMDANIVKTHVPLLGLITCNRRLLPQLTAAMHELQTQGLAGLVRTFNGCFSPRMQVGNSYELSRHAYGIAVDINAGTNRYGDPPNQDPRLVQVMERWGFTWGGRWLVPDGMHFEFVRFVTA